MATLASLPTRNRSVAVNDPSRISDESAWAAVMARDRTLDGRFVTGVLTTGIYCRPSCAARHPKRENVRFFATPAEARATGLRPCLRCRPDEVTREATALERVYRLLAESEETPSLDRMAEAAGYSPHHFHRLFKRATGVTPAAYYRRLRGRRVEAALAENERITDAIYDAGYSGPARFYADTKGRLGMTPSAWRDGGRGETIRWATAETALGTMLVAATEGGICRLSFDEDEAELKRRFPNAAIEPGGAALSDLVERTVAAVNAPEKPHDLPLDVRGTAFQEAVWRELSRIPPGESLSYAALAARVGRPKAVRAAGTACGANQVAVLIPCHRARRGDGSPGGYAYGLQRKAKLLEKEGWQGGA
ncbi:bifunctional DNA-binding transcriptional regulator/O6-methylguanine-DNA methyltransferase Ada [Sphingosinicella sp. CPCC 101087]|uniref:bifunctional DNA-binding transcriptional regulator/O6-methylguanine-DNA methyltransferase Ada n=1 Tax=Sphingosinicella sp. CPCC 101087 TaxID=2497754 RepID=UPI00101D9769|nr:bifunctional DNA-binding transcriptional regulator/O6-methylguanine-DNA methyltransferase Ada [Sphingosinicella sp. CPCC 101087]